MEIKILVDKLKRQNLPLGEYAVFGSAVMAIRGIREAPNIDVIVTNKLWDKLLETARPDDEGFIRIGPIKISNWWFAPTKKDLPTMISEAEMIDGAPFVRLKEVRNYKSGLNREKDKNDIALIDQHLESISFEKEPVALGIKDYSKFLDVFVEHVNQKLGDDVLSMIVFGSSCRGQAKGSSDLDIFVFYNDAKVERSSINNILIKIIVKLREHEEYNALKKRGIYPEIYPFLISKKEASNTLWVFLDATDHGVIIKDLNRFGEKLIRKVKAKVANLGGRRVNLPNGKWCWVLFDNFSRVLDGPIIL